MKPILDRPALWHLIERMKRVKYIDEIVVATTTNLEDEPVVALCEETGVACFRGSEDDVLARVFEAHQSRSSDIVVQVWGDCILLDPKIVDLTIVQYLLGAWDLVAPLNKDGYPPGQSCYVFSFDRLQWLNDNALTQEDREHVSIHFQNNPDSYKVLRYPPPPELRAPELWMAMDRQEHFDFIQDVYEALYPTNADFGLSDILKYIRTRDA